ncbi:unnamed protein product [Cyclocybe aegerita]|uniref:Uncharacterized protein n=1 Tax=Cyclocybe aegerita TaxID=1973307 RepID=A0A8S0WJ35_CYCAE|nr:unnamed protein product [Cyclocybe aegerita]
MIGADTFQRSLSLSTQSTSKQHSIANMLAHLDNNKLNKVSFVDRLACRAPHYRASTSSLILQQNISPCLRRRAENIKLASKRPVVVKVEEPTPAPMAQSRGITLPTSLSRPALQEVNPEAIYTCDARLQGAQPNFIREKLAQLGPSMINGIRSTRIMDHPRTQLPKELEVVFIDTVSLPVISPTHILAVRPTTPSKGPTPVKLFLIHELIFAANCSAFPKLPKSHTATAEGNTSQTACLPVISIAIPSISTFEIFQAHLYLKDTEALRAALLPSGWSSDVVSMLRTFEIIHGLWLNARAFQVCDEPLFETLNACWSEALRALTLVSSS